MALSINTNNSAAKAASQLTKATNAVDKSNKALGSGKKELNGAELAVATQLLAEADTNQVAARNISDGVSAANIADGALDSASKITEDLAGLAEQAASGQYSGAQLTAINNQYQSLSQELDRIAQTTEFNGQKLLSAPSSVTIQAGNSGDSSAQVTINFPGVSSASLGLTADLSSPESAKQALEQAKTAVSSLAQSRGEVGAATTQLGSAYETLKTSELLQRQSASRITDVDYAEETARKANSQIQQQAAVAIAAQANSQPSIALKLLG